MKDILIAVLITFILTVVLFVKSIDGKYFSKTEIGYACQSTIGNDLDTNTTGVYYCNWLMDELHNNNIKLTPTN